MRVLALTAELPYAPGGTGGSTRQFELLRRLAANGHEVVVAAPVPERLERDTGAPATMRAAGIDYRPLRRPPGRAAEVARALLTRPGLLAEVAGLPWVSWQFEVIWTAHRRAARELAERLRPDVVVVEHDHLAGWVSALGVGPPAVLSTHNATWRLFESRARAATGLRRRALSAEAARYRRMLRRSLHRFELVVAVSGRDAADFSELGAGRVEVVPNGADFRGAPLPSPTGPPTLLFTGSMDHAPNRDAALWLGRELWPRVREAVPGARLVIAGRGPGAGIAKLGEDPTIEITGPVPDMEPYYRAATAVIAPLRSGGGTRLKIFDALAAGRPVASTSIGAEGIELEAGRDLLVADEPESLAAAAAKLLTDPELGGRLAAAGRERAARTYDWDALAARLESALEPLAGRRDLASRP